MSNLRNYLSRPVISKEHGAYAILLVPLLTGFIASRNKSAYALVLVFSTLFFFLAHQPFEILLSGNKQNLHGYKQANAKFWLITYFILGSVLGLIAIVIAGNYLLFIFAGISALFFSLQQALTRGQKFNRMREIPGIMALVSGAPAMLCFLDGALTFQMINLWVFNALFFLSSSFFVHLKVSERGLEKEKIISPGYQKTLYFNLFYQSAVLILLIGLYATRFINFTVIIAFLPMILHCLLRALPDKKPVSFRIVGLLFLAYSVFFGILLAV